MEVCIIGAGISGIISAITCIQYNIDFFIIDKHGEKRIKSPTLSVLKISIFFLFMLIISLKIFKF